MRIHTILHAPFEKLGYIETWANKAGYPITYSHTYKGDQLPSAEKFDFLILMGGPQSPREVDKYPYLTAEMSLTKQAIDQKKVVIGFCLGAQIIAESLGAATDRSPHKEVGFYPIELTSEGNSDPLFNVFSDSLKVMHWHNDMPGIPKNGVLLAKSEGCPRQAFRYGKLVYGIQFHPEMSTQSIQEMIQNCPGDLQPEQFVQSKQELLKVDSNLMNQRLEIFLNSLVKTFQIEKLLQSAH